ncbi:MAG: LysR substrate-binding domain-containing protein [Alphaproteobacteria bacterium]
MDVRLVRSFVEVARWHHFGRAAEELNTTQPAISQHIRKLEERVGCPLFKRGGNQGISITAAGEVFLVHAKRYLELAERMVADTRNVALGKTGILEVGLSSAVLSTKLPSDLRRFRSENPSVELKLLVHSAELIERMLLDGDIDAAITTLPSHSPFIQSVGLYTLPIGIAVPMNSRLAELKTIDPSELNDETVFMFPRPAAPETFDAIIAMFHAAGSTPNIVDSTIPFPSILALVASGAGCGIVPAVMSGYHLEDVSIRPVSAQVEPTFVISLQSHKNSSNIALPRLAEMLHQL